MSYYHYYYEYLKNNNSTLYEMNTSLNTYRNGALIALTAKQLIHLRIQTANFTKSHFAQSISYWKTLNESHEGRRVV